MDVSPESRVFPLDTQTALLTAVPYQDGTCRLNPAQAFPIQPGSFGTGRSLCPSDSYDVRITLMPKERR